MYPDKKKILVTGATGQLGQAMQDIHGTYSSLDFIFADRGTLDITNEEWLSHYLDVHQPDVIINTAAYTAVDKAENDKEAAFLVNEKGVAHIALACKARNIQLLHISTDYVFDGTATVPYQEIDPVNPQTVYGKSKLAGERMLQEISPAEYYIIRTSWLYSKNGHNFYNTMLRLAREGKEISVVDDQWGSPTLASDLAQVLIHIVLTGNPSNKGIYHYSGEGECTWYAFAKAILEKYYPNGYILKPVNTDQYPTDASRPVYSVLNKRTIKQAFNLEISDWERMI
jgi:dTDP-4-dehydrorhamnose reductase